MSRTNHHGWQRRMSTREYLPAREIAPQPVIVHVAPVVRESWREVALSDCNYGCKVYERAIDGARQVQHSRTYGCRNTTVEPITLGERLNVYGWNKPEAKIQHHTAKRRPVTRPIDNGKPSEGRVPRVGGSRGKHYAQMDVPTPSLMQLAKARAKALGL